MLYAGNHRYDDFVTGLATTHFLLESVLLLVLAILLLAAWRDLSRASQVRADPVDEKLAALCRVKSICRRIPVCYKRQRSTAPQHKSIAI